MNRERVVRGESEPKTGLRLSNRALNSAFYLFDSPNHHRMMETEAGFLYQNNPELASYILNLSLVFAEDSSYYSAGAALGLRAIRYEMRKRKRKMPIVAASTITAHDMGYVESENHENVQRIFDMLGENPNLDEVTMKIKRDFPDLADFIIESGRERDVRISIAFMEREKLFLKKLDRLWDRHKIPRDKAETMYKGVVDIYSIYTMEIEERPRINNLFEGIEIDL